MSGGGVGGALRAKSRISGAAGSGSVAAGAERPTRARLGASATSGMHPGIALHIGTPGVLQWS
jgi:hypothetical protein